METLQIVWFLLIGVLLIGYAILDGFDLGVGFWHLFEKEEKDKRLLMNAIGPVWDGNEVWILTGGGAIFAAFPPVYASVFSGFYLALMLLLLFLILRAVSFEFRSAVENPTWRKLWDLCFGLGSLVPALLYGVAVGNIMRGLPLDEAGNYTGTFFGLLNPYALLVGLTGFAMFALQGALYLAFKTEGELAERYRSRAMLAWKAFLGLFILTSVVTLTAYPELYKNYQEHAAFWIFPFSALAAIVGVRALLNKNAPFKAFLASSYAVAASLAIVGFSIYPNLVPALGDPARSITIFNGSSSERTLLTMLVIALIGMPIVLTYTVYVYRVFKGKVEMGEHSY